MKRHILLRSASKDGAAARRPVNRARARGLLKMNTSPAAVDVFTNSKSAALFAVPTPCVIGPKRSVEYFALYTNAMIATHARRGARLRAPKRCASALTPRRQ